MQIRIQYHYTKLSEQICESIAESFLQQNHLEIEIQVKRTNFPNN